MSGPDTPEGRVTASGGHTERFDCGPGAHAQTPDDIWPEPVDFLADGDLTGVPELREDHLPPAIFPFVRDTADRMGVDSAAVALAALVALASVIDDKWELQPKQFDSTWTESARIWGAIVGDPSVRKTPIIRACTAPIDRLDARARKVHADDMRQYERKLALWKHSGGDLADKPSYPKLPRFVVENTTVEALSEVLRTDAEAKQTAPARKILVRQDEMAEWIASFDRYRSGGKGGADRGSFIRLYNGGPHTIDRVGRGSFAMPNWSACILGGIQPEPIQRIARESADDGLLQRFIYCVADRQSEGVDRRPDYAVAHQYEATIQAASALHPPSLIDAATRPGNPTSQTVVLHENAHRHRQAISDLANVMSAMPDTSNRLKAAFGKWNGLFARLALLFHLVEIADARAKNVQAPVLAVVSEDNARRAANYIREIVLPHLLRAEAIMFSTAQSGHARWIAGYILARRTPRVTLRDVVQAYGALRPPECRRELLDVMESLVTVGWLQPEEQSNQSRAPTGWSVNPAVFHVFAVRARQERDARARARGQIRQAAAEIAAARK